MVDKGAPNPLPLRGEAFESRSKPETLNPQTQANPRYKSAVKAYLRRAEGNHVTGFQGFVLKAKARIWP